MTVVALGHCIEAFVCFQMTFKPIYFVCCMSCPELGGLVENFKKFAPPDGSGVVHLMQYIIMYNVV